MVPRRGRLRRDHARREYARRPARDPAHRRRRGAARHVCSPHNPSGPIAHAHSVHVSALLADCPFLEFQLGESSLFFDLIDGSLPDPEKGRSAVPAGNGLGVGIDFARLQPLLPEVA
ncbi:MAG: hypothetical protein IPI73_25090 [Betaproteobacteria bacterium]|nr:hypothetical protein [Betaproteobacteria bacterium]